VAVSLTSVAWAASTYQTHPLDVVVPPGAIVTFERITNGDTFASGEAGAIPQVVGRAAQVLLQMLQLKGSGTTDRPC